MVPTQGIVCVLAFACLLAGCGASQAESTSTMDCVVPVRFEGKIYIGTTYSSEPPTRRLGVAEEATCDDNGTDVGVSFPEDPRQVPVWAYEGVDPDVAIGVRDSSGDFVVLVANEVSESKAQRIADSLK